MGSAETCFLTARISIGSFQPMGLSMHPLHKFSFAAALGLLAFTSSSAIAQENYESWPPLKSTFVSTGGGGIVIKGYDPVIVGGKCITTFMAVTADAEPKVYPNVVEYDAVPVQGGTLCERGKWKSFDGASSGTTPFRFFFKDGVFRAAS
jgi:hypothetical protein